MNKETAILRSKIIHSIRNFFIENKYIEVDTPLLSPDLIPESSIDIFKTDFISDFQGEMELYLVPSPEIFMKKLLADDYEKIFQISKCFRNAEQIGPQHNPEFTMLEWYSAGHNYMDSARITEKLLKELSDIFDTEKQSPFSKKLEYISMNEAFKKYADIDIEQLIIDNNFNEALIKAGLSASENDSFEEYFNKLFLCLVEPELPKTHPVILYNYPAGIECLAKNLDNTPWKERWELYIGGIEIANCYTEEIKKENILNYYNIEGIKKESAKICHKIDKNFADYFSENYPACSGVAMGIDRLIMIISGNKDIKGVIQFPFSDILYNN